MTQVVTGQGHAMVNFGVRRSKVKVGHTRTELDLETSLSVP